MTDSTRLEPEAGAERTRQRVLGALSEVRDPELDESLTELGFVESLDVDGGDVSVRLRLPTYFCAPNFAYLMAADAKESVSKVPGVTNVRVELVDHFVAREITEGLASNLDLEATFPGETIAGGLTDLRDLFRRKGFIARQERLSRSLRAAGVAPERLASMTVADLPATSEVSLYLRRRAELGIDCSGSAPFLVTPDGSPIPGTAMTEHLRFARTVGVSIEANAGLCRGLLETRYGKRSVEEAPR